MLNFFIELHADKACFVNKRIFQTLSDEFHQNAFGCIRKEGSKLRTYAMFKKVIGIEKYFSEIKNRKVRVTLTKFRLSNHNLMIETGRHKKIQKEMRFCPLCHTGIEDEVHFLFYCPVYERVRMGYLNSILLGKPNFQLYTSSVEIEYIMLNLNKNTSKFISDCFELRSFLINTPKRCE